ncbi:MULTISPECIES: hypothetical protein [unclassified Streptomyces]|uniref:hypothetical protein n=1 Tax=unclassified Streptomyces TaxID=2593676 RepID=UPI002259E93F|nr:MULTISPECIES: hypothetical protein [unclassified Streptomyces]MCX4988957.1 hypothetical protein [Streptomyces sp. NBC_00568]MCX5005821.1 hypothetical protein [Streptomyces sp. NBC_00638]
MAQRWDADRRQWVDDGTGRPEGGQVQDGADAGGAPPDGGQQWWAAATQAGSPRPDHYPPAAPVPPQPMPQQPPQHPWPQQQSQSWSHPQSPPQSPPWPGGGAMPGGGGPQRAGDSRRLLLVIVAVAVLAGGVGGGLWALTRDDPAGHPDAGPTGPAVTVTASQPGATPDTLNTSGSEGAYADPAETAAPEPSPGYSRAVDPLGYTVDVPDGWAREEKQGKLAPVVTYTAPDGNRRLLVFEIMEPSAAESSAQAESIAQGAKDYQYLDRRTGTGWTEFSYSYYDKRYGATQTVDHRFQAADGTPYAVVASGPTGTDLTEQLTTAVNSFCPTGFDCTSGT